MTRWKAAAIHLGISVTVMLTLALVLAYTWYPLELVPLVGGLVLIGLVAFVDACLGPLLTLIVFDTRKPKLRYDLAVIILIQAAALLYGLYTLFESRPVYLVFNGFDFHLMTAPEVPRDFMAKATREEFRQLPLGGPRTVAFREPPNAREQDTLFMAQMMGFGPENFPQYYAPYAEETAAVLAKARPVATALQRGGAPAAIVADWLTAQQRDPASVRYLPLHAKRGSGTVLLDGTTAAIIGILPVPLELGGQPAKP